MTTVEQAISSAIHAKAQAARTEAAFAIAAKSLKATKQQGEAAVELIESAATLGKEIGKGQNFDRVV